ncbi:hypothetical protein AG0111_0g12426 [Alternaria gaisen]|uniref:Uncharacterized protein n=1 Tax=Alternaria gaisen TaxID=167740 RepID=A0ACB6F4E3_9PLEO|nr:hypothetical protein AG0111_0g12426 [Alternaria gaisen]
MVTSNVAVPSLSSAVVGSLQARQWEWASSAPAWSEPAWTQPAWSDSAILPVPTEPVSTPSTFLVHSQVSTPTHTSTSDWIDTHRPDPSESKTGLITFASVLGGIIGLAFVLFLVTLVRRCLHGRVPALRAKNASDVEVNAGLHRNSQAPALDTPPGSVGTSRAASSGGMRSMPRQSEDVTDMPRVASPLNGLTHGPRRSRSLYQNNIPPQETHWP